MSKKTLLSEELESSTTSIANLIEQSHQREPEQQMLELIRESRSDEERYVACLRYGQLLVNMERFDEAGEYLGESARIALRRNDDLGLALSHEKLGDLAAAEGEWLSARHHYRYALRKANHSLEPTLLTQLEAKANSAQAMLYTTVIAQNPDLIPLGQEYLHENLAISFVHRDIFLKNYFARCLECSFCHDWCCSFGADIDIQNVEKIQQQRDEIMPFIRPWEVEWFERDYSYYEEYAGNQFTRINPQGPRCVFISKDQRGCGLHRYAFSRQMDYHEIKPLVCILFPLSFSEGVLCLAQELDDDSLVCAGAGSSAYRSLRNELEYYFGRDCVEEMDAIESRVLSQR
ncbi:MAG: DUF3109 family protein [Chloroflexota bacterium]|nr:DUF3109 family protein [Chloroflexota bacterium]